MTRPNSKPLVYSCSGCSSAAQLANAVALKLDRAEVAEMSCIAGVGGDVPSLVRTAKSGRPIVALDGCALACVKNSLARHAIAPALHFLLSDHGVRKRHHADYDPVQAQRVFNDVSRQIARTLDDHGTQRPALMQPSVAEGLCP
jgi:uncharacterized metal-binding protein